MDTVVLGICAVLAVVVLVLSGVVVELFRDVRQLRAALGILDRPLEVELGEIEGTPPSVYGLPSVLDEAPRALVLFFHEACATCGALASGFRGQIPETLWLVIEARHTQAAQQFLRAHGLEDAARGSRVLFDEDARIAEAIGISTTPVAFQIQAGAIRAASSVPSVRYLASILEEPIRLDPPRRRPSRSVV